MTKAEKNEMIASLEKKLSENDNFYLTDVSGMTVEESNKLRRECFKKSLKVQVVKNTLLRKAMERIEGKDYSELFPTLKGNTAVVFTEVSNMPAKVIKDYREKNDKPLLKGAFLDEAVYVGDGQLEFLASLKSKNELIGDVILLLQSPAKNVISSLQSGGSTLSGLIKTLSERNN